MRSAAVGVGQTFGLLAALSLGGAAVGCGDSDVDPPGADGSVGSDASAADAGVSPSCMEATEHSDLAWIESEIFAPSCAAFGPCHQGAAVSAGGLNLEEGNSEANLVGVASGLFPEYDLVVPGDPDASYLMIILGHRDGPIDSSTGTMPYNNPLLCVEKRDAIERWITALPAGSAAAAAVAGAGTRAGHDGSRGVRLD